MNTIFSGAAHVLIWLGEGTSKKNDFLTSVIHSYPDKAKEFWKAPQMTTIGDLYQYVQYENISSFMTSLDPHVDLTAGEPRTVPASELLLEIAEFMGLMSWFHRVWIVQEFMVAESCHFQVGASSNRTNAIIADIPLRYV
jgi:Heterokaryon incompatibility protein (HET)